MEKERKDMSDRIGIARRRELATSAELHLIRCERKNVHRIKMIALIFIMELKHFDF